MSSGEAVRKGGWITKKSPQRRIVYVLRTFPEISETFIAREIEILRNHGVPVSVLAAWRAAGKVPDGLEVRWLSGSGPHSLSRIPLGAVAHDLSRSGVNPRRWARALRLAWFAARAFPMLRRDTWRIHAHFANDAAVLARYLSVLSGVPYRMTAHAYDLFQDPFLLVPNLRAAQRVYTVSKANLTFLHEVASRESLDSDRFRVLRCGIDLERFSFRDPAPVKSPARLFCPARLVPKKGHGVLLEAVRLLTAGGCDVVLDLAGEGPLETELKRQANAADLGRRVSFLGSIPPEEVRRRMREADLVVLGSRIAEDGDRDGLPVVLIESLALGTPALATRVAGIPELLTEETGWTVEPDRPDLLAHGIRKALEAGAGVRTARARTGRGRVEAEFDIRLQLAELRPPDDGLPCPPKEEGRS